MFYNSKIYNTGVSNIIEMSKTIVFYEFLKKIVENNYLYCHINERKPDYFGT